MKRNNTAFISAIYQTAPVLLKPGARDYRKKKRRNARNVGLVSSLLYLRVDESLHSEQIAGFLLHKPQVRHDVGVTDACRGAEQIVHRCAVAIHLVKHVAHSYINTRKAGKNTLNTSSTRLSFNSFEILYYIIKYIIIREIQFRHAVNFKPKSFMIIIAFQLHR